MNENTEEQEPLALSGIGRYVPLAVYAIAVSVVLLIPFKIISYGYMPYDDALRHAAKAVSGKPWSDILVLDSWYTVDHNFGWHLFLRQIHLGLNLDADWLVVFSIVFLFLILGLSALPWLRRPEAWLASLLLIGLFATPERVLFGRPYILTMSTLVSVLLLWNKRISKPPTWQTIVGMSLMVAMAMFVHGTWYLWALPIAAFFLARQYRWGLAVGISCLVGTLLAAVLTGHPVDYITEAVQLAFKSLGQHQIANTLAKELRPGSINPFVLVMLVVLIIARKLTKINTLPIIQNPAFWLVCLGMLLGLKVMRFWFDWGLPALMVLLACDLQLILQKYLAASSVKRVFVAGLLAGATFLTFTSNSSGRWTLNFSSNSSGRWTLNVTPQDQYLIQNKPELDGWLPEKGGVFYTADMSMFYKTFLKNPSADWRYIVGFEPTIMPPDDFKTFRQILTTYEWEDYKPWVEKMKSEDRLFIPGPNNDAPQIPRLEWKHLGVSGIWAGRLWRTNAPSVAP